MTNPMSQPHQRHPTISPPPCSLPRHGRSSPNEAALPSIDKPSALNPTGRTTKPRSPNTGHTSCPKASQSVLHAGPSCLRSPTTSTATAGSRTLISGSELTPRPQWITHFTTLRPIHRDGGLRPAPPGRTAPQRRKSPPHVLSRTYTMIITTAPHPPRDILLPIPQGN